MAKEQAAVTTPKKLSEVDLTLDLGGSENHNINYVSRIRTQYLFSQAQSLVAQSQFADAKAASVIGLMGLIALRGPITPFDETLTYYSVVYLTCAACSVLFAMMAIFPRYPGRKLRDQMEEYDRWSWPALASPSLSPAEYSAFMQTSEVSQLVHSVALSNAFVSRILLSKFKMLRFAFIFALTQLVLLAFHLATLG
jgi:hypothetical protein